MYAGPQGQPGLDQINFVVPQDTVIGCYVSLAIRVRGALSNQTSLSVNGDPYACAHPLGLSYSALRTLDAGGSIQFAQLNISNDIYSNLAPRETADFQVSILNSAGVAAQSGLQTSDAPIFKSYSPTLHASGFAVLATSGDAGAITVSGPDGKQLQLQRNPGHYTADAPSNQLPFFTGGPWQLSATGGADYGAFQQTFTLPPTLKFTNLDNSTTLANTDYTLRWDSSGFVWGDIASVFFTTVAEPFNNVVNCTASATSGELLLPASLLQPFAGKPVQFTITVQPRSGYRQSFSIPATNGTLIHGFVDYYFSQRIVASIQ